MIDGVDKSAASAMSTGASTMTESSFTSDFETFLTLLTTQLQQQDPLSPMDTDKFTTQLVQFSSVEQAIRTNTQLEQMNELLQTQALNQGIDYIGREVALKANQISFDGSSSVELGYDLPEQAESAEIMIRSESGETVRTLNGSVIEGSHAITWDGRDDRLQKLPAGQYSYDVMALDEAGEPISVHAVTKGTVDAIETQDGGLKLIIGGRSYGLDSVLKVHAVN